MITVTPLICCDPRTTTNKSKSSSKTIDIDACMAVVAIKTIKYWKLYNKDVQNGKIKF